ncbi:nicotinate-nucleotide adenylyltransferase [Shewanella sp. AS1]|uniref:nicotinate-nucleotide adenylyltransferase n=1 Tax=Shewanella sp. AS1 TaxID=2907626 RepID=UPI001F2FA024|nr:nicotinate-nucleotide adenylyltransferase [Shewanella sp. AS1]MCE9679018.1 nicotinate-nucleotide adenylyltransferase [Shewanella sp. AS1]
MRIGILGGTFDPIHFGHIRPALAVQQALTLDQLWLMPNHIPPHKAQPNSNSAHRLAMAQLVCEQYPPFSVCDIEINRESPSYSVVTLQTLRERHPKDQLLFIMGMDSFIKLPSWYQWQRLLELCHIVVCRRPGWTLTDHPQMMQLLEKHRGEPALLDDPNALHGAIFQVEIAEQPYSSTALRALLTESDEVTNQAQLAKALPADVWDYIKRHRLYLG